MRRWLPCAGCVAMVVLGIAAAVLFLVPVSVPYEVYEPRPIQVPKDLAYSVIKEDDRWRIDVLRGLVVQAFVTIENQDIETGTFIVKFTFETQYRYLEDIESVDIQPGERGQVMGEVDLDLGENWKWSRSITPMVTETTYEWVTKHKDVRLYEKLFGLY